MVVNNWHQDIRINFIEEALLQSYAQVMIDIIPPLITEHCDGCELVDTTTGEIYDHPSKLHHNICMMDKEEQVDYLFDIALFWIEDSDNVTVIWFNKMYTMDPPPSNLEYQKFCSNAWREEWMTDAWRDEVKEIVCQHL